MPPRQPCLEDQPTDRRQVTSVDYRLTWQPQVIERQVGNPGEL